MALTDKQLRFCEEYIIDLNATRAYKSAYNEDLKDSVAAANASRLLTNANILTRIADLKAIRSEKTMITAEYVLSGIKEVAERCLQKQPVMIFNGKYMEQKQDDNGNNVWEFDSHGANKAFEMLGKHIGIFEKDNNQKKSSQDVLIIQGQKFAGKKESPNG